MMNIVATVGYGDMFPMTDIERMFVVFMINIGDAIFAVAFGLIASIVMQASMSSEEANLKNELMLMKEVYSEQTGGDQTKIRKLEQYYNFLWKNQ